MEKIKNLTFKGNRVLSNIADKNYVMMACTNLKIQSQ